MGMGGNRNFYWSSLCGNVHKMYFRIFICVWVEILGDTAGYRKWM